MIRLSKREKTAVFFGSLILGIFVCYQFAVKPVQERLTTLKRVVQDKRKMLGQLQHMGTEHAYLKSEVDRIHRLIEHQPDKGRVLSRMEQVQKECGLLPHVQYMRPSTVTIGSRYEETSVEVKVSAITSPQLIEYLTHLETLEFVVGVKSLDVKLLDNIGSELEATVQVATVTAVE